MPFSVELVQWERIHCCLPLNLQTVFEEKVMNIRAATDGALPPEFVDVQSSQVLRQFTSLTAVDIVKLIQKLPFKQSDLDPMPTWLLKSYADVLAPFLTHLVNASLSTSHVPALMKTAYITPLLKKPGSDVDAAENYRPVSNLPMLSKLLERAVCKQLISSRRSGADADHAVGLQKRTLNRDSPG